MTFELLFLAIYGGVDQTDVALEVRVSTRPNIGVLGVQWRLLVPHAVDVLI